MNDFEDDFEYDSGEDSHRSLSERDIEVLENLFYEAEDCRVSDPKKALSLFEQIIANQIDTPMGKEWKFKAIVQILSLKARSGFVDGTSKRLRELLLYLDSVSRSEAVESLFSVLDSLSSLGSRDQNMLIGWLDEMLETLSSRGQRNQNLWLTVALKQCRTLVEMTPIDEERTENLLSRMKGVCRLPDGMDDVVMKGAQLMDIYAIELTYLSSKQGREGARRMKGIISRCEQASSAVSNPRSLALIREHAGKLLMRDRRYEEAYNEFFEAFKTYSDTGNASAARALNFAVLCNMCALSTINPFDSREAKAYHREASVEFFSRLRDAYFRRNIDEMSVLIRSDRFGAIQDESVQTHLDGMLHRLKLDMLQRSCPAYRRVDLETLGRMIRTDVPTTKRMLMRLILNGSIKGLLNNGSLEMEAEDDIEIQEALVLRQTAQFITENLTSILNSQKTSTHNTIAEVLPQS